MILEMNPVEFHTIILAMDYMPHQLLLFVFDCADNFIWNLVTSYQNHMHDV